MMVNASAWLAAVPAIPWPQSITGNFTLYVMAMSMFVASMEYIEFWVGFTLTFIWTERILLHLILCVCTVVLHLSSTEKHQNVVIQVTYGGVLLVLLWFGKSSPIPDHVAKHVIIEVTSRFSVFVTHGTSNLAMKLRQLSVAADHSVGITSQMRQEIMDRTPAYEQEVLANYRWYDGGEYTRRSGSDRVFELEQDAMIDRMFKSAIYSFCDIVRREMIPVDRCNRQDVEERKIALLYFFVCCLVTFICYRKLASTATVVNTVVPPKLVQNKLTDTVKQRVQQRTLMKTPKRKAGSTTPVAVAASTRSHAPRRKV